MRIYVTIDIKVPNLEELNNGGLFFL